MLSSRLSRSVPTCAVSGLRAGCLGQLAAGDQTGVGLDRQVRFEIILLARDGLVHVPGLPDRQR